MTYYKAKKLFLYVDSNMHIFSSVHVRTTTKGWATGQSPYEIFKTAF